MKTPHEIEGRFGTFRKLSVLAVVAQAQSEQKRARLPIEVRLWDKVEIVNECWVWKGATTEYGYGKIGSGCRSHPTLAAHRVAYEVLIEELDPVVDLDHVCRNPRCVNPFHVEPVTHQENIRRGAGAVCIKTGRCKNGHELTPESVRMIFDHNKHRTVRRCRICDRAAMRACRQRKSV